MTEPPNKVTDTAPGPAPRLVKHGTPSNPTGVTEAAPSRGGSHVVEQTEAAGTSASSRPRTAGDFAKQDAGRDPDRDPDRTSVITAVSDDPRGAGQRAEVSSAGVRQARLKIERIEPWSAAKVTFALSVALGIVAIVAVTILWIVLSFAGVWDQINSSVTTVLSDSSGTFDITDYLGLGRMVGFTIVLSALNTVIMTVIAVIGSHLYNLAVQLLGGIDVTLSEDN